MGIFTSTEKKCLRPIVPADNQSLDVRLWNVRGEFKVARILNIGTQMSIYRLNNGKYLIIDTIPLSEELKAEIDALTNNGNDIEAIVATHPFHTLSFGQFYEAYPNPQYYGTPRHLRKLESIKWTGDITDNLNRWVNDGVEMRIPAGAEWINPLPESTNHFNCVWTFFKPAKTLHVDDSLNYFENTDLIRLLPSKLFHQGKVSFHWSLGAGQALLKTPAAPNELRKWLEKVMSDWDFENLCVAHKDIIIGDAKDKVKDAIVRVQKILEKLEADCKDCDPEDIARCTESNVDGTDCG
jgi:hypothetical protein